MTSSTYPNVKLILADEDLLLNSGKFLSNLFTRFSITNLPVKIYIDFSLFQAALILGVSPNAPAKKISESHKKIMILNHPDKGGSPYLASKINEAKDFLNK